MKRRKSEKRSQRIGKERKKGIKIARGEKRKIEKEINIEKRKERDIGMMIGRKRSIIGDHPLPHQVPGLGLGQDHDLDPLQDQER